MEKNQRQQKEGHVGTRPQSQREAARTENLWRKVPFKGNQHWSTKNWNLLSHRNRQINQPCLQQFRPPLRTYYVLHEALLVRCSEKASTLLIHRPSSYSVSSFTSSPADMRYSGILKSGSITEIAFFWLSSFDHRHFGTEQASNTSCNKKTSIIKSMTPCALPKELVVLFEKVRRNSIFLFIDRQCLEIGIGWFMAMGKLSLHNENVITTSRKRRPLELPVHQL